MMVSSASRALSADCSLNDADPGDGVPQRSRRPKCMARRDGGGELSRGTRADAGILRQPRDGPPCVVSGCRCSRSSFVRRASRTHRSCARSVASSGASAEVASVALRHRRPRVAPAVTETVASSRGSSSPRTRSLAQLSATAPSGSSPSISGKAPVDWMSADDVLCLPQMSVATDQRLKRLVPDQPSFAERRSPTAGATSRGSSGAARERCRRARDPRSARGGPGPERRKRPRRWRRPPRHILRQGASQLPLVRGVDDRDEPTQERRRRVALEDGKGNRSGMASSQGELHRSSNVIALDRPQQTCRTKYIILNVYVYNYTK